MRNEELLSFNATKCCAFIIDNYACRNPRDIPQRRVKRWAFCIEELVTDPAGKEQFSKFLDKEFSGENLKYVMSIWSFVQMEIDTYLIAFSGSQFILIVNFRSYWYSQCLCYAFHFLKKLNQIQIQSDCVHCNAERTCIYYSPAAIILLIRVNEKTKTNSPI